jgi:DNA-binding PadR family transcriptional regulator
MASTGRNSETQLLLGEWACLGVLAAGPTHGFAIAQRLRPEGDVGRVWSLSRPLTYRSLEQLANRGLIEPVGEVPGIAGGNKTVLDVSSTGRRLLAHWLATPVVHLRDLRSELLLKLVIARMLHVNTRSLIAAQHQLVAALAAAYGAQVDDAQPGTDVVSLWRSESARAALRFLQRLSDAP